MSTSVLFDAPGPRARARNGILTVVGILLVAAVVWFIYSGFDKKHQFEGKIWQPFLTAEVWTDYIIPGLAGTLSAAAVAAVLALVFGAVFGLGRLSDHAWIAKPSGFIVEVFRAIPLLLLIFFLFYFAPSVFGSGDWAFFALVAGLMFYNGSVLAEVIRAGVRAVPRGQSEAAYGIGMRKNQVMRLVLLPQAITSMMPAIVSQLVVLLKDTALGYIIAYVDLLNYGFKIIPARFFGSLIPAAIVVGVIYVGLNMLLSYFATWLEKRSRRSKKTAAPPIVAAVPGASLESAGVADLNEGAD
ncbi:amino acid ABC transporter permease [Nonomuraea sediminis]|uniref:amino acid ABC transporter permease n=1 Tax=Nonomuraea sediminis TaxID=2835864 RepID=UPI001BDC9B72|nr:ABC transporter permease subunit [Nonomuraea sediminis]